MIAGLQKCWLIAGSQADEASILFVLAFGDDGLLSMYPERVIEASPSRLTRTSIGLGRGCPDMPLFQNPQCFLLASS
jgi:hypothetical protein